jgi:predicted ArsR family transcriptional regulator
VIPLPTDLGKQPDRTGGEESFRAQLAAAASLAHPQRQALYHYVSAQPEPVSREQAATELGIAQHAAKFHLDRLVADGLLEAEYRRPAGRRGPGAGRPTKLYRRSTREIDITVPQRRYEFASRLLCQAITAAEQHSIPVGAAVQQVAAQTGEAMGQHARERMGPRPRCTQLLAAARDILATHGYQPRTGRDALDLTNCPFQGLARDFTALICGMNLGLIQGLLRGLRIELVEACRDPAPSRCCVRLVELSRA